MRRPLLAVAAVFAVSACTSGSPVAHHSRPSTPAPSAAHSSAAGAPRVRVRVLPWRLPEPVGREAAVATSRGVVVAGGLVAGDQSTAASYRLDLGNGHTVALPDLPVPVHDVGGALTHGMAEVIGGGNATEQSVVQAATAHGGWRVSGRLPTARSDLVAVVVGDRVFAVGWYDGGTPALADILVSTNGGAFDVFGRLRVPVRYAAAAMSNGAIWVFGGERNGAEVDPIQRVDLGTGRVRVVGHLPHVLGHASALAIGRRILLVGGRTGATTLSRRMWWFDPASGRLRRAGVLPTPLADAALVTVGGAAYLIGGETPELSDRVLRVTFRLPVRP
ncbi:MAG: Kelch repeat-containing protein [Nocardioidaceae bacterium]